VNTTTLEHPQPKHVTRDPRPNRPTLIDISRGARLHQISEQVYLDSKALDTYNEIDRNLGRNLVGSILSVVAQHVARTPGGGRDESVAVAVRRLDSGCEVDMLLTLSRSRRGGQMALVLTLAGEREQDESLPACTTNCQVMTPNLEDGTARLRFNLTMEIPGPSQGDAYEHLENLGFDPRSFTVVEPVDEVVRDRLVTGTFEVIGTPTRVAELRAVIGTKPWTAAAASEI